MKIKLIEDIISFLEIEDNWDGYGGVAPKIDVVSKTLFLLAYIDKDKITDYFPNPHGTISIEFKAEGKILSLEIGNDFFAYYINSATTETIFLNNQEYSAKDIELLNKNIQKL